MIQLSLPLTQFQPNVAFNLETSHLICSANQITGFRMKCNTGLRWANFEHNTPLVLESSLLT